jgi:hypothetical protein
MTVEEYGLSPMMRSPWLAVVSTLNHINGHDIERRPETVSRLRPAIRRFEGNPYLDSVAL